jgi:hypothetical protein
VARYLLESSAVDGYLLEDGTGVLLMEGAEATSANAGAAAGTLAAYDVTATTSIQFLAGVATGTADAILARGALAASLGFATGRSS